MQAHSLLICLLVAPVMGWNFMPIPPKFDQYTPVVPVAYNPAQTQLLNGSISGSYWTSSYLTGSNDHQYMVISNTQIGLFAHGSILDITTSEYTYFHYPQQPVTLPPTTLLNVKYENYTFEALTTDNLSKLRTTAQYANSPNGFNLTFTADHPILYNMALGQFFWGVGETFEWGMPSGRTEGTLTMDGEVIDVIPEKSFTWYDRQWGDGIAATGNWTWYELHFPDGTKASIWASDNAEPKQTIRAATILYSSGFTEVVPFDWAPNWSKTWLSPRSGIVYPLEWSLKFANGGDLKIEAVVADQEIMGGSDIAPTIYEGFAKVTGYLAGGSGFGNAFGVVEMGRFVPE